MKSEDARDKISTRRKSRRPGIEVYRENPFWQPMQVQVGKKRITVAGGVHISDDDNAGEAVRHSGIHIIEDVDRDQFVKLYTKNMKIFFDLRPTTQKVLMAVLAAIQKFKDADFIFLTWFDVEDYSEKHALKISEPSFHRAMRELLEKGFLAESEVPGRFWINPHLFFNGDRMTFVREWRIKESSKPVESKKDKETAQEQGRDPDTYDMFPTAEDAEEGGNQ